ncbi:hypothetical protein BYZ73_16500 [Rhodovulum viride]|uniref:DDE family transposase n=1 Tax=Rhodovulum viride TaxID=1231134 RepID=A0ABX9DCT9_9RHOB|nr:hypothetical protein BYZ73_16500 [Rhodovulum viride]
MLVLCCAGQAEAKAFFDALDQFDLTKRDYGGYDRIWSAFRRQLGLDDIPRKVRFIGPVPIRTCGSP